MLLRVMLATALIVNPVADALAQGAAPHKPFASAFRPNSASSTRITQTDAQDWIIEGAANKLLGNPARSLELFEAARERLEAEMLPEPYATQVHQRMNTLVVSVGGAPTEHVETPADPESPLPNTPDPTTPTPNQPLPGGGSPFNQPVANGSQPVPNSPALPAPAAGGIPNVPDVSTIAEGIKLDDIGLPVTKTKKPSNANLLIASPQLALVDLNTLMKNEELRSLMWWITAGRIAFYSKDKNLLQIIQRRVSRNDLNQLDSLRNNFGMGNYTDVSMGPIADLLAWAGMYNKDYNAEARSLIQMFDGSSLGEIADTYVRQATKYGTLFGIGFSLWPASRRLGPTIGTNSGMGNGGFASRFAGVVSGPAIKIYSDSLSTFLLNANYMFKIAALYGIPVDNVDKQLLGLFILSVAKGGMRWQRKGSGSGQDLQNQVETAIDPMAGTLNDMGANFAKAQRAGKGNDFLHHALGKVFGAVPPGTAVNDPNNPFPPGGGGPNDPNNPFPPGGGGPNDPNNPFPPGPTDPNTPPPQPQQPPKPRKPVPRPTTKQWIKMIATTAIRTGKGAAFGAIEAATAAYASKKFFEGMYADNVRLQNKAFLRLLNSKKGFAFLKILIHSMYLEQERIAPIDPARRTREMNFILNLARSSGICSPEDFKKLEAAKKLTGKPSVEIRMLRFSCPRTNDTYYYDLLMRELLTFNAVRTKNVARLRASILRDRLKMAQLLIQFQFMDGHQSQEEQDFFEEVTSKILGITSPEQTHFLNIFEGYVKQAGGLVPSQYSVTGYAVRNSKEATKLNFNLSPTPLDAPSQVLAVDWNDTTEIDTNGSFDSRPSPF